ncbi:MAG: NYN domain-containing protein, partial [Chloroflexota bacterium]
GQVEVIFAPEGQTADALLISRIRRAVNPPEYTLISSDRQVLAVARERSMRHIPAKVFAERLAEAGRQEMTVENAPSPDEADDSDLSQEEVAEWLALFESAPRVESPPKQPQLKSKATDESSTVDRKRSRPEETRDPATLKDGARQLSDDEVDAWLRLFSRDDQE